MKKAIITYLCLQLLAVTTVFSQINTDSIQYHSDSVSSYVLEELPLLSEDIVTTDTVSKRNNYENSVDVIEVEIVNADSIFKPDPLHSVWLGAIIPGYGQIANKKYWKLPIVYGGFLGFAYAIFWNNGRYVSYKNAYRDISDNDATTNYHLEILPAGYTLENYPGGITTYTSRLKSAQDQFRQYRDLSILLSIGYYAVVLLEAYVDAQLYDFDISPDLALNISPARIDFNQYSYNQNIKSGYGIQCSIRF